MPRGDGTGPMGLGSMTGRAAGYCAGYPAPGYMNAAPGGGLGWGRGRGGFGRGMGWGRRAGWGGYAPAPAYWGAAPVAAPYAPAYGAPTAQPDPNLERQYLENQLSGLQSAIDGIRQRLDELQTDEDK